MYVVFINMDLQESIRKIIREESSRISKIYSMIDNIGLLSSIKAVGGYDNMVKIVGEDFFTKGTKIDLIIEIVKTYGPRNQLYLGDFDIDIITNERRYDDGSYEQTYIIHIDDDGEYYYKTYEFDEHGNMIDEPIDFGYSKLINLPETKIDEIIKKLLEVF